MRSTRTARFRAPFIFLAFATLLVGLLVPAPSAQAAVLTGGATLSHPFSNPAWWPLRIETKMDCYHGNPGCTSPTIQHGGWLMDVVSTDFSTPTPHEPVYPMGAGIVHYGVGHDVHCGGSIPHGRGNWLWIDHGNGTLSWYGHLAWPFKVANGAYVTPQSRIALVGNSGYSNCKKFPNLHYIDIAVEKYASNGLPNGTYAQFTHLYACVNGSRQSWPEQINPAWRKWNDVPSSPLHHEHLIPASDGRCIPTPPPTPTHTSTVRLAPRSSGALRATWVRPRTGPARRSTVVLIQEFHPAIRQWLDLRKHVLRPGAASTVFSGLHVKHSFRVKVSFYNGVGMSATSPWAGAVAR